ncbi:hypothetical protein MTO96_029872 [Rhipicephalus appendiculatus]
MRIYREYKQRDSRRTSLRQQCSQPPPRSQAGALRTLAYRLCFDDSVDDAMSRVCGADEKTIEHIVANCEGLTTAPTDGTTLHQALGFLPIDAPEGGGVVMTKNRVSEW